MGFVLARELARFARATRTKPSSPSSSALDVARANARARGRGRRRGRMHPSFRRTHSSRATRDDEADANAETNDVPSSSSSFPFVDPSAFVDAKALGEALRALRGATDIRAATWAAEWLDRAAGDSAKRMRAAREAGRAFVEARREWAEVPVELVRRMSKVLESTAASRGDVGWLAREEETTRVDGGETFEACLERVRGERGSVLNGSFVYVLVPGLFASYYPLYYDDVRREFGARGVDCRISRLVDGEGTVDNNAAALAHEIESIHEETGKRVIVFGHSKGGVDAGAALAVYDERLRGKVRGFIAVQSPYGGSPIATDLLSEPLLESVTVLLERLVNAPKGDGPRLVRPIKDLTYASRRAFLARHPLPAHYDVVSFTTTTKSAAAGLYPAASYISSRYGDSERGLDSDGLVMTCDAQIPNAVVVNAAFENDHADCTFPAKHPEDMARIHADEQAANLIERQRLGFSDPDRVGPPLPPPVGVNIVSAQRALGDALPERLKSSPSSADYHEALVGVLLSHEYFLSRPRD